MMKTLPNLKREQAAQLVAEGRYEYGQIAEKVGVDRITLQRWRKEPKFMARVDEISREFSEASKRRGLARKEYRIDRLADRHSRLTSVIEERSADAEMAAIPGGKTGLIVRKPIASGGMLVGYEYAVDTGTLKELRSIEEQVAKELGQLVEKHEHKVRSLKDLTDEELAALASELDGAADAAGEDSAGTE